MAKAFTTKAETRNGFLVSEKRKAVWKIQLELFDELYRVCKKHHLKLFGDSGTLLGAVRHKGFIPWDDDMDFVMFRKDYDKLMKIAPNEIKAPYFFQTPYTDHGFVRPHAQLRKNGTTAMLLNESTKVKYHQGIFIDIFPLDFISEDEEIEKARFDEKMSRMRLVERWYGDMFVSNGIKGSIKKILRSLIPHPSIKKLYGDFEYSCSHVEKPSDIVAQVSFYGKYTDYKPTPARCFSEIIYLPFEDRKIPFPKDTDTVLKAYYGKNYMKPVMDSSVHGELILDTKKDYKQVQSELKNNTYKIVNL